MTPGSPEGSGVRVTASPPRPIGPSRAQEQAGEAGAALDGEGCAGAVVHEDGGVLSRLQTPTVDVTTHRARLPARRHPAHAVPGPKPGGPGLPPVRRCPTGPRPHLQLQQPLHVHREDPAAALQAGDGLQGPGRGAAGVRAQWPWGGTPPRCRRPETRVLPPRCSPQSSVFRAAPLRGQDGPRAPQDAPTTPRRAHSRVAMAQGLDADQHTHCVPGPQPGPALQLPGVCGDRPGLQRLQGGRSRGDRGWGASGHTAGWGGWA